jgi:phospholipase C
MKARYALVLALLAIGAGCSSSVQPVASPALPFVANSLEGHHASHYIKHLVVIIQENRSFENFFAGFRGANAPMYG